MKRWLTYISAYVKKYPHRSSAAFFGTGFLWDFLTLWRADGWYENTWFGGYLLLTMGVIIALARIDSDKTHPSRGILIAALQFCFGSLSGGLLVLYGRSGTLEGSAAFMLMGAAIVLANDLWGSERYAAQTMRIGVWYALLLAYISMSLPVVYGRIGDDVFVHGIVTGFIIVFALIVWFRAVGFFAKPKDLYVPLATTILISGFFLTAHFLGIMPAVPLALRNAGIAHMIVHEGSDYTLSFEEPVVPLISETSRKFHSEVPTRLYCFSQIFVPTSITTSIRHRWERYGILKLKF
jgi:hypothetical protein